MERVTHPVAVGTEPRWTNRARARLAGDLVGVSRAGQGGASGAVCRRAVDFAIERSPGRTQLMAYRTQGQRPDFANPHHFRSRPAHRRLAIGLNPWSPSIGAENFAASHFPPRGATSCGGASRTFARCPPISSFSSGGTSRCSSPRRLSSVATASSSPTRCASPSPRRRAFCCSIVAPITSPGLRQILVYPGAFIVDRVHNDDAGVVHDRRQVLSGESWCRGKSCCRGTMSSPVRRSGTTGATSSSTNSRISSTSRTGTRMAPQSWPGGGIRPVVAGTRGGVSRLQEQAWN